MSNLHLVFSYEEKLNKIRQSYINSNGISSMYLLN